MNDKELVLELTKLALQDFPMSERKKQIERNAGDKDEDILADIYLRIYLKIFSKTPTLET